MRAALRWLWRLALLALLGRRHGLPPNDEHPAPAAVGELPPAAVEEAHPLERSLPPRRDRAELAVATALLGAGAAGAGFVAVFVTDHDTQLLGLCLGLAFLLLALAAIVAGKLVVPQERAVEPRSPLYEPAQTEAIEQTLRAGAEGVTRRRLLLCAGGAAGAGIGAAAIVPLGALGPSPDHRIDNSPWKRGTALVDEQGRPWRADDIPGKSLVTAFPQGAYDEELSAPVVVVRLPLDQLMLPPGRSGWAPQGIVAYSKICTHAGCAVSLYRAPTYQPTSSSPALICPCHYSTFDVRRGAAVTFGPAGRPLPQLPLEIAADGSLVAAGPLSGSVGPAWWSVRR